MPHWFAQSSLIRALVMRRLGSGTVLSSPTGTYHLLRAA